MSLRFGSILGSAGILCLLSGCSTYRAKPLVPEEIVSKVEYARARPDEGSDAGPQKVSFVQTARWMLAHGPDVREAVARYQTTLARSSRRTPLPNPGLEIGPQFGFGPDQGSVNPLAPFGSIGFSIPLGKRLRRQDELNRALADVARIEALVRHREIYLQMRVHYTELVLGRSRAATMQEIVAAAKVAAESARKLVDAGQATALDVALFELDFGQSRIEELESSQQTARALTQLAGIVGVHRDLFEAIPERALPDLPTALPSREELKQLMVANHGELARLRVRYETAERALRLEIARQWPDFNFSPFFDSETGERRTTLGLTLGMEVPLFDRNEQAIAEAESRREEVRIQYVATANRALANLESSFAELELARGKAIFLRSELASRSEENVKLARRAMEAGAGDVLKVLDTERSHRRIRIQLLNSELEERAAWVALEQTVGRPLLRFPDENSEIIAPTLVYGAIGVSDDGEPKGDNVMGGPDERR